MVALLAQTGASWFMTGLIWTMQILNYPLLALIAPDDVPGYEQEHNRRFGRLVGPGVLVTIVSGVIFLFSRPAGVSISILIASLVLAVLIVAATIRDGVRAHTRLARSFDPATQQRLVRTNWIRVFAWTALGLLDLAALAAALP